MGGLNVKNTIVERVLQIIAPHPCSGCGKVGVVLCNDCKNDIIEEPFVGCITCGQPEQRGICSRHHSPIQRAFIVGQRTRALETCINNLKFHNLKGAGKALAEVMHETLPLLPSGVILVPVPTVRSHVRQRGYDQVELIAKHISVWRRIPLHHALRRRTTTTQHTVGRKRRQFQAKQAFELAGGSNVRDKTIFLIDDIITTGATVDAAAQILVDAGATVWVAALAYQPLD